MFELRAEIAVLVFVLPRQALLSGALSPPDKVCSQYPLTNRQDGHKLGEGRG